MFQIFLKKITYNNKLGLIISQFMQVKKRTDLFIIEQLITGRSYLETLNLYAKRLLKTYINKKLNETIIRTIDSLSLDIDEVNSFYTYTFKNQFYQQLKNSRNTLKTKK